MELPKSTKQQIMEFAGEKLLEKLKDYTESKTKSSSEQKLLDEVGSSELVSESANMGGKSDSKELVRYHSVVDLDDLDDFDSCADSVDNMRTNLQKREQAELLENTKIWPYRTPPKSPSTLPDITTTTKIDSQNTELSNFVQKKSIAQGMMDLALVSANTNQLRYVMDIGDKHPYFYTSITLIILSLVMQLIVGLALIYNSRFNIRKKNEMRSADRINDLSVIGVFLITLVNVFISTFNGSNSGPYTGETVPVSESVTTSGPEIGNILNATIASDPGSAGF